MRGGEEIEAVLAGAEVQERARAAPAAVLGAAAQREQVAGGDRQGQVREGRAVGEGGHRVEGEGDAGGDGQAEGGEAGELGGAAAVGGGRDRLAGIEGDDGVEGIAGDFLRFHCGAA